MNKAQLIGNVGKDPEIRSLQNGSRVCNLAIATSESWKDKATGERKEKTEWHRIVIFNPALVELAEKYIRKGSKLYIEGQIETRKWQDQEGKDRYQTEIVLKQFDGAIELLDKPPQKAEPAAQAQAQTQPMPSAVEFDDDIPFT